jgi:hypothetical protein
VSFQGLQWAILSFSIEIRCNILLVMELKNHF